VKIVQNVRAAIVGYNEKDGGILNVRFAENETDALAQLVTEFIRIMREEADDETITISERKDCYGEKVYRVTHNNGDFGNEMTYKIIYESDREPGVCTVGAE
jgi:hypothetical protein